MRLKALFISMALLAPPALFSLVYALKLTYLINYSVEQRSLFILIIIAPILEEVTFRGLLQEHLYQKTKDYLLTVILVNLFFVLPHILVNNNFLYLFVILLCGIIFSVGKILYGVLLVPILLHIYFNLCLILFLKVRHLFV